MIVAERAHAGATCTIKNADCENVAIATFVSGLPPAFDETPASAAIHSTPDQAVIHACLSCGVEYINAAAYILSSLGADEIKLMYKAKPRARGRR